MKIRSGFVSNSSSSSYILSVDPSVNIQSFFPVKQKYNYDDTQLLGVGIKGVVRQYLADYYENIKDWDDRRTKFMMLSDLYQKLNALDQESKQYPNLIVVRIGDADRLTFQSLLNEPGIKLVWDGLY